MKEWVISVTVTVFSTSVISLILPSGKLSKYIKSVFSLIMVFVILQPVFKLKDVKFDFQAVFNESEFVYQSDYFKENCVILLKDIGVENFETGIIFSVNEISEIIVEKVVINLQNSVINSDKDHIDIIVGIKSVISEYLKIDDDAVVIYE